MVERKITGIVTDLTRGPKSEGPFDTYIGEPVTFCYRAKENKRINSLGFPLTILWCFLVYGGEGICTKEGDAHPAFAF